MGKNAMFYLRDASVWTKLEKVALGSGARSRNEYINDILEKAIDDYIMRCTVGMNEIEMKAFMMRFK